MTRIDSTRLSQLVHDLKSPLASVLDALALLERQKLGPLNPTQLEIIQLCQRNARQALARIEKLTD